MKRYLTLIALLTLSVMLLLAGCDSKPEPTESPLEPTSEPVRVTDQEQPAPPSPLATPTPEVVPEPDTGIVRGTLRQTGSATLRLEERTIYLASIMLDREKDGFEIARMSSTTDPRARVNADGSFIFIDVQPDRYVLSTVTPRGESILLVDVDTGLNIVIEVKAGEITDLGMIPVDFGF